MVEAVICDLCVIGAGAGGLSVVAGAAQLGANVVLVEAGAMGGDCLNTGCVPSKALLAAAKTADTVRHALSFGVRVGLWSVQPGALWHHVSDVVRTIAPHDSRERFERLGVTVIAGRGRFLGPDRLQAGEQVIKARRFVIATGSRPAIPPIRGLDRVPYLTNETLFDRNRRPELPKSLLVIGGGPVGVEMALAHQRLGVAVTLVDRTHLLSRDDPELVAVVRIGLKSAGVTVVEGQQVAAVASGAAGGAIATLEDGRTIPADTVLVASGRVPDLETLDLDAADVAYGRTGIMTDDRMRTSNRNIFAVGDVTGRPAFTHAAAKQASVVLRNALFRWPAHYDDTTLPWVTYAEPELAHVGLSEAAARERYGERITVQRWPFADNDRAQTERTTAGLVKLVADRRGRVLGAGIVGPHAGEQIALWCLAVAKRHKLSDIAGLTLPYPTLAEAGKRAAGSFYEPFLFGPHVRRLVRWLRGL